MGELTDFVLSFLYQHFKKDLVSSIKNDDVQ